MSLILRFLTFAFIGSLSINCLAEEPIARIVLIDPGLPGTEIPVQIKLKPGIVQQGMYATLFETFQFDAVEIPCQVSHGENDLLSWVYTSNGDKGSERAFHLHLNSSLEKQKSVSLEASINDSSYLIKKNEKPLLAYRHALLSPPAGQTENMARSGFIHPLFSPSGEVMTQVQPADHLHHVGIWNPWTKVSWKGVHTDFWNLGLETGTVRFKNLVGMESGDVLAEIRVVHDHVAFVETEIAESLKGVGKYSGSGYRVPGKESFVVMAEEWMIRVWSINDGYLLDFVSTITNLTDDTLSLDAYRYGGGIGYRATEKWNNTNSQVLTSEGKTWDDGDATRAKWCRVSGELSGIEAGLLFMSNPGNYDQPQPMRIWPKDNNGGIGYQYFEFTPIREKSWVLKAGKTYSQRYRIWINEGEMSPEVAEAAWNAYAHPADIKISYLNKPDKTSYEQ
ncbi:MAG: PmoA family protein [Bacteroidetes bacterium]|jgi:hypothetical protein|nr:PmoA family protein [Bacteroidota bacterium]MBT3749370.1 PmoA family protein [Bacteroidota bacterium]MBT4410370.1 PmoA family protein [Bacteroidota bacterium]MBT7093323.1 PmoA family protein [Bacteroidota bacterium]MBT7465278.1 PmoA family protein [Bacteroidota bacterium]